VRRSVEQALMAVTRQPEVRQGPAGREVHLREQESLVAQLAPPEGHGLGMPDRPAGEHAVAVVEWVAPAALVGQADRGEGQAALLAEEGQVVVAPVPARVLVDLLHRHDVRLQLADERGDLQQIAADPGRRAQALVHRQGAPGMGHVETQQAKSRHG